ncbi:thioredoxin family protein [Paenibacillus flagellatus]|uniref:Thioredoxin n=1 Tax=Paenibacillus flagellatus TaxID=2211139 RepID=A0A2V5L198_9BACL|nr:thioredoxin family protein [Paenibacillus flagellatus]PYI56476.1 thioredoxin [Paenibacillus flagellatus]
MKKLSIYLGIIVALFVLLFIVNQQSEKAKEASRASKIDAPTNELSKKLYGVEAAKLKPETLAQLNDANYQNIVKPQDLKNDLNAKKDMYVYYFSTTCSHCQATTPILNPIAKEAGVELKQLNLWEYEAGWNDFKIEATPTLVYYKGGKEVQRMVGGVTHDGQPGYSPDDFKKFFEEMKKK